MPDPEQPDTDELAATNELSKNEIKKMLERHGVTDGENLETSDDAHESASAADASDPALDGEDTDPTLDGDGADPT